jgi:hypothetical protein
MSDRKEILTYYKNFLRYFEKISLSKIKHIFIRNCGVWQHPCIVNYQNKCVICKEKRESHINVKKEEFFKTNKIYPKQLDKHLLRTKLVINIIHSDDEDEYTQCNDDFQSDSEFYLYYDRLTKKLYEYGCKLAESTNTKAPSMSQDVRLEIVDKVPSEMNSIGGIILHNNDDYLSEDRRTKKIQYCDICFSDIKDRFNLMCGHFFCRSCIIEYVKNSMGNISQLKTLKCPKAICNETINNKICEMLFEGKDLISYRHVREKMEGLSSQLNLPCSIPDCDSYAPKSEIKKNYLICKEGHKFCVKCLSPYHYGKCKQKEEDNLIMKKNKMIKKCPNCRTWVEKADELCNNVTCINIYCNYSFCWICMREYDKKHYTNPLSTCFGLATGSHNILITNRYSRTFKCLLIFIILITLLVPLFIIFFSFIVVTFYILAYVLDGSAMKNVKMRTEKRQKLFRLLITAIYATMSFALISFGYITICGLIIVSPFIYLYKRCCNNSERDNYKI